MTSAARFSELRRLFEEVCDLPADARRAALAAATGDTALIAEGLAALLRGEVPTNLVNPEVLERG